MIICVSDTWDRSLILRTGRSPKAALRWPSPQTAGPTGGRRATRSRGGGAMQGEGGMGWGMTCMCRLHCRVVCFGKDCFCRDGLSAGETLNQPLEHLSKLSLSFATTVQGGVNLSRRGASASQSAPRIDAIPRTEGVSDRAAAAATGFGRQPSF